MKRIDFSDVKISNRYKTISKKFGYEPDEYIEDLLDFVSILKEQKYIEIYENKIEKAYGRAKDSNSKPGSTPWYIDLYHDRVVKNENDPLVVLEFEEQEDGQLPVLVVKFLVHHDDIFGTRAQKNNRQVMSGVRRAIDAYRRQGND